MGTDSRGWMSWLAERMELGRAGASANLRPMEGLRGVAVFLVFLVHCMTTLQPWFQGRGELLAVVDLVHAMGNVGVDLFFVLSGFLIYGAVISRAQPFGLFIARRIYPAFLAVFAIYLLLSWLMPSRSKLPADAGEMLLYLVQNLLLLPGLFPIDAMITVAWSLSYEFFYYLLIPVLVGAFGLRRASRSARIAFFIGLGVIGALASAVYGGPVRLLMFIAGILLFEWHAAARWRPGSAAGALCLLLALVLAAAPAPGYAPQAGKFVVLGALFVVVCLSAFGGQAPGFASSLSWTPLRWLGNMSYSYYLIHGLALNFCGVVMARLMPSASLGILAFCLLSLLLFAVTLVPALALYLWIERSFSLAPASSRAVPVPVN